MRYQDVAIALERAELYYTTASLARHDAHERHRAARDITPFSAFQRILVSASGLDDEKYATPHFDADDEADADHARRRERALMKRNIAAW